MTISDNITQKPDRRVVIRSVALPSEHGGWGFLIEPILLGLIVALSWRGALLALAATGVFLIHQPLKMTIKDRRKGRRPPRLMWAQRFVAYYGLMAFVPVLILLVTSSSAFLIPIALAVPLASVQLYYDSQNRSRELAPEVCGALALAMIAPSIAVLGGWGFWSAMALWGILSSRATAAILYVRSRIRLSVGKPTSRRLPWAAHIIALIFVMGLFAIRAAPWTPMVAFIVLLTRAYLGLSKYRRARPVKVIGFMELAYGLITTLIVGMGYII